MQTRRLVLTSLFAALIFIAISFIHAPNPLGGIIHFGDAFIFLAAVILPFPYALPAAAIGAGMANLFLGIPMWAPFTVVIKPLMTLCFSSRGNTIFATKRNLIAPFGAGLINLILYYIAAIILFGNWLAPLANIPGDLIQFAGSAALYFLISYAFDRMELKARLKRQGIL